MTSAQTVSAERAANLAENPFAGQGPVLLDIGGDVGAIVLRLPPELLGAEIELHGRAAPGAHGHPHGEGSHHHPHHHPHVAVVERPVAGGSIFAAVFPAVQAGRYELREPGSGVSVGVEVTGGSVTEADWP
jgi:hypothetical protein